MTAKKDTKANKFELGELNPLVPTSRAFMCDGLFQKCFAKAILILLNVVVAVESFFSLAKRSFTIFFLLLARFTLRQAAES